MGLDITPAALEAFLAADDGRPVTLVNVVRKRPGGEAEYERYGAAVAPLLRRAGGEVIYAGDGAGTLIGDDSWDVAVVTRYPSRRALAEMVRDPAFEALTALRHAAVADGLLFAFTA